MIFDYFISVIGRNIAEYDVADDQVLGPSNKLQQVMLRSIAGTWKMPLFFDFDAIMTKDLLQRLIVEAEAAGARVVAVVLFALFFFFEHSLRKPSRQEPVSCTLVVSKMLAYIANVFGTHWSL